METAPGTPANSASRREKLRELLSSERLPCPKEIPQNFSSFAMRQTFQDFHNRTMQVVGQFVKLDGTELHSTKAIGQGFETMVKLLDFEREQAALEDPETFNNAFTKKELFNMQRHFEEILSVLQSGNGHHPFEKIATTAGKIALLSSPEQLKELLKNPEFVEVLFGDGSPTPAPSSSDFVPPPS